MNNPTYFVNVNEYYYFIYAIGYMLIAEIIIWLYNFKEWIRTPKCQSKDYGTILLVIFACWGSFSICTLFRSERMIKLIGEILLPHYFFYLGLLLLIFGTTLRSYAVWKLKHAFSLSVKTKAEQNLITTGIYRYIRNPAYMGTILCLLGTACCFRSVFAPIFVLLLCFVCYGIRIHIEEKALLERFGNAFSDYSSHSWRLIPFIW